MTSKTLTGSRSFDVNRRSVFAMRSVGCGHHALERFGSMMNMPKCIAFPAFHDHNKVLCKATKDQAQESMTNAVQEIIPFYQTEDGITSIGVRGDGTWRKRGYTSFHGVTTLISIMSGKIIDLEVKSGHCHACSHWQGKKGTPAYDNWLETHKDSCERNYSGSASAMECDSVIEMFERSVERHSIRYSEYLGDGDSKAIKAVNNKKVYGPDIEVEKLECVNHVSKRMFARLSSLKQTMKAPLSDGKKISGKGRLTGDLMKRLQLYYGRAIRMNKGNLGGMNRSIWAIYYHITSTDEEPMHDLCPYGQESWCKWNAGDEEYDHHSIPVAIAEAIKPVFESLSKDDLLSRCLKGSTSNVNESYNNVLWRLVPKTDFSGLVPLEMSANMAVLLYNEGASAWLKVMRKVGMTPGRHCIMGAKRQDHMRLLGAQYKTSDKEKTRRNFRRATRKKKHDQVLVKEGPTYGAGMF